MPIKIIREIRSLITVEYSLIFDTGRGSSYSFPCDHNGALLEEKMAEAASINYEKLMTGEIIASKPYVNRRAFSELEPAVGECCKCSQEVVLDPDSEGLCYCGCGACYNASGQSIRPRSEWEENY